MTTEVDFKTMAGVVAGAYANRFDEEGSPEILQQIFTAHDMSGPLALALFNDLIEIKHEDPTNWIVETYKVLTSVFDFNEDSELNDSEETEKPESE